MSNAQCEASRDVTVVNPEGLHARPVMKFVDMAQRFQAGVSVVNITRGDERLDGKSAMQLMLLEATQGCVLRIEAKGVDAETVVEALAALVSAGFSGDSPPSST